MVMFPYHKNWTYKFDEIEEVDPPWSWKDMEEKKSGCYGATFGVM
jgi:hypothetical protein